MNQLPNPETSPSWQTIASKKREEIDALVDRYWSPMDEKALPGREEQRDATSIPKTILEEKEIGITENYNAEELLEKLAKGELSAEEVTKAFCRRAAVAHKLVNCLSEPLFDQAIARARTLDTYLHEHRKLIGPLHGLPISVKDQFRVEGAETSVGYVGWLGKRETAETESWVVRKLIEAGAVVFAKTNVPTSLMAIETNNNIVGYTWNPHNRFLSSGGSSGGEASLIAMQASILGLGTDVGASIRLPAGVCGIYGLKPSHGRLPYLGVANSMDGQETINSVVGPMGRDVSSLRTMMRAILAMEPWMDDPKVIPLPWRKAEENSVLERARTSGLVFGVMEWDGVVKPHPPIQRTIKQTVEKLRLEGHEVIPWSPPAHAEAFDILWNSFIADGGKDIHDCLSLSGEPAVPQISAVYGESFGNLPVSSINDIWSLQKKKYDYQARYLQYWNNTSTLNKFGRPVDAVILPVAPTASFSPGQGLYPGYTGVINVLDFTALSMPVSSVDKAVDGRMEYSPINDFDANIWNSYDPDLYHGTPVGIQIMGRRLEEEKVLAVAEEIQRCLRG